MMNAIPKYLLGVSPETIMKDYMLSNEYLKENIEQELESRADIVQQDPVARKLSLMKEGVVLEAGSIAMNAILNAAPDAYTFFEQEYDIPPEAIKKARDFYLE